MTWALWSFGWSPQNSWRLQARRARNRRRRRRTEMGRRPPVQVRRDRLSQNRGSSNRLIFLIAGPRPESTPFRESVKAPAG